ncbi:hypothetical protein [Streptomyces sp. SID12501]|uniref:Uncharacterized protein n=1 Tax=Streptomyces sp. SID12501 TaxID=2706042 RepID=A0A6B3C5V8_9ACTN|nr:hypothetical protein [Streptomyces sp. SID12501]NEC92163.1 hypothetical protein [Streptomyces sp. SID12501]
MTAEELRDLLVQARGEPSPLYGLEDPLAYDDVGAFTSNIPLDDAGLALPAELAEALRSWSLSRPPEGFASRPALRKHVKQGVTVSRRLARHLGPLWPVRYSDERHRSAKWVCWSCDLLHWERNSHGIPVYPVDLTVEGEFQFGPLRAEGFGDFFPDDPAAGLDLSEELVADLRAWAKDIDAKLNVYLQDRDEIRREGECERQLREGAELARRVAHEVGPDREVTYKGLANGGLISMTSITWRGDQQV